MNLAESGTRNGKEKRGRDAFPVKAIFVFFDSRKLSFLFFSSKRVSTPSFLSFLQETPVFLMFLTPVAEVTP